MTRSTHPTILPSPGNFVDQTTPTCKKQKNSSKTCSPLFTTKATVLDILGSHPNITTSSSAREALKLELYVMKLDVQLTSPVEETGTTRLSFGGVKKV